MMSNLPTILIIFGATGDLMRKKIAPALFNLYKKGKLPERFRIIAFSRRDYDDRMFRDYLGEILESRHGISKKELKPYLNLYTYAKGDFTAKSGYEDLASVLAGIDKGWGVCTNKLFYLAVAPETYETIFNNLKKSGLTEECEPEGWTPPLESTKNSGKTDSSVDHKNNISTRINSRYSSRSAQSIPTAGWTRVIVEKPFGRDFQTAQKLDLHLGKLFQEVQIYRIDHYLAKEMLQNILAFRFSNNLFEKNWSGDAIERIDIKLWEKIGVEERGPFYDSIGALRDVGQNHLLQMLALVTMDLPAPARASTHAGGQAGLSPGFSAATVRQARNEVLSSLKVPYLRDIRRTTLRAQYVGYRQIQGVEPRSQTETYFKILAFLESSRWRGVPIIMESGKRMGEARKEITVTFKHATPCLCPGEHHQNKVVFTLEPEERITIHFWSKKPGLELAMEERTFEFLLRASGQKTQYVEEYEKLLLDCIVGDQTLFTSTDEVKHMWKYIDPIVQAWQKNKVPLKTYLPNSSKISEELSLEKILAKPNRVLKKEIGFVGLGKMGIGMVLKLKGLGWKVTAFDSNLEKRREVETQGVQTVEFLSDLEKILSASRIIWIMVPAFAKATAGKPAVSPVDEVIFGTSTKLGASKSGLVKILKRGDIIIDGGNSYFEDSVKRAKKLAKFGIKFLDVGVSGGPSGARNGLSLMVGGEEKIYKEIEDLWRDLAVALGYAYMGKSGSGHFVKMVHNGIEYGMMQAIAEGFSVMKSSHFGVDLKRVSEVFNHGSVIESRLIGWMNRAFEEYGEDLSGISGSVGHTGEGEWTVKIAKKLKVPVSIIEGAFKFRVRSKKNPSFTGKVLSALRNQFGGHSAKQL